MPTELKEIEDLRSQHRVRPLTDEEEGTGIHRLPNGVYGFTYSPASENFPLFRKRDLKTYEAHKLPDGSAILVGFVTKEAAAQMQTDKEVITIHLFPDPKDQASTMVVLPMARVVRHKEHSQRGDTGLEVQVGPASSG